MNSVATCADSMPAKVLKGTKSGALNSIQTITAYVEPSLAQDKPDDQFQFERCGYLVADRVDHKNGQVVLNKITSLKDTWAK